MWCAYAGDGVYKAETDCGVTLVGVDESQGLPWCGVNTVGVGYGDKAYLCGVSIGGKVSIEPSVNRTYLIDAACRDMRVKAQRKNAYQRLVRQGPKGWLQEV